MKSIVPPLPKAGASRFLVAAIALGALVLGATSSQGAATGDIHWLKVDGIITDGTAQYLEAGIHEAENAGASAVVIELDTPGGVVDSTRDIVKSELNATIPVVVWVGPRGARAGSAGVFITLAANVAAMAPGTNIGAAHPIGIGPPDFLPGADDDDEKKEEKKDDAKDEPKDEGKNKLPSIFRFRSDQEHLAQKIENDTLAWAEAIARERGRNVEWAKDAVLHSVSIVAEDALAKNVVDLIASDRTELLQKLDGMKVRTAAGDATISSASATVTERTMSWKHRIIAFLANPTVMSILGLMVMVGVYAEFQNPGLIFPGVAAGVALIGLLVGAQAVPVNVAALLLVLFGFVCFILEIKVTSYGMLTVAGILCVVAGLSLLVDETTYTVGIAWSVVVPALTAAAAIVVGLTWLAVKAMAAPPLGDNREYIGRVVKATADISSDSGTVSLDGTLWNARSAQAIPKGSSVRIVDATGLTLQVVPELHGPVHAGAAAGTAGS